MPETMTCATIYGISGWNQVICESNCKAPYHSTGRQLPDKQGATGDVMRTPIPICDRDRFPGSLGLKWPARATPRKTITNDELFAPHFRLVFIASNKPSYEISRVRYVTGIALTFGKINSFVSPE